MITPRMLPFTSVILVTFAAASSRRRTCRQLIVLQLRRGHAHPHAKGDKGQQDDVGNEAACGGMAKRAGYELERGSI